jgi:hypothetical protein
MSACRLHVPVTCGHLDTGTFADINMLGEADIGNARVTAIAMHSHNGCNTAVDGNCNAETGDVAIGMAMAYRIGGIGARTIRIGGRTTEFVVGMSSRLGPRLEGGALFISE